MYDVYEIHYITKYHSGITLLFFLFTATKCIYMYIFVFRCDLSVNIFWGHCVLVYIICIFKEKLIQTNK